MGTTRTRRRQWVTLYMGRNRKGMGRIERLVASGLGLLALPDGTVSMTREQLVADANHLDITEAEYSTALDAVADLGWISPPHWTAIGVGFELRCPEAAPC